MALLVCALAGVTAAQPAPPPAGPDPVPAAPMPASVDPRLDAGWQLYHDAFTALLTGKRRRAAELIGQLQREHPGHPAAYTTARSSLVAAPAIGDVHAGPTVEQPSKGARAELALFQTQHGIVIGVELCILMECDSPGAVLGLALLGGAAGAGASLAQDDLTSGQRALINGGTFWGFANSLLLLLASQPDDAKTYVVTLMAGQIGGLGLGAALNYLRPTSGQVGITNSGGQWALALTGLTLAAAQPDSFDEQDIALILLAAMDGGLGVGAYIAKTFPRISRGRGWVIDAGGIVGGVITSPRSSSRATSV